MNNNIFFALCIFDSLSPTSMTNVVWYQWLLERHRSNLTHSCIHRHHYLEDPIVFRVQYKYSWFCMCTMCSIRPHVLMAMNQLWLHKERLCSRNYPHAGNCLTWVSGLRGAVTSLYTPAAIDSYVSENVDSASWQWLVPSSVFTVHVWDCVTLSYIL